jgi:hypothetical protein
LQSCPRLGIIATSKVAETLLCPGELRHFNVPLRVV